MSRLAMIAAALHASLALCAAIAHPSAVQTAIAAASAVVAAAYARQAQTGTVAQDATPTPANRATLLGYASLMGMTIGASWGTRSLHKNHRVTAAAVLLARTSLTGAAPTLAQPLNPFADGLSSGNLLASTGAAVGRAMWLLLTFLGDALGGSMATFGADFGLAAAGSGAPVSMTVASVFVGMCFYVCIGCDWYHVVAQAWAPRSCGCSTAPLACWGWALQGWARHLAVCGMGAATTTNLLRSALHVDIPCIIGCGRCFRHAERVGRARHRLPRTAAGTTMRTMHSCGKP